MDSLLHYLQDEVSTLRPRPKKDVFRRLPASPTQDDAAACDETPAFACRHEFPIRYWPEFPQVLAMINLKAVASMAFCFFGKHTEEAPSFTSLAKGA
jgi:hypothetical protein